MAALKQWGCLFVVCLASTLDTPSAALAAPSVPAGFTDELVVGNLDFPVGLAPLRDGRMLFIEQGTGRIQLIENSTVSLVGQVPHLLSGAERGLLGIAIDPRWPHSPYLYVLYTATAPSGIGLYRYTASGDLTGQGFGGITVDESFRRIVFEGLRDETGVHVGGTLRFGPDRALYVSLGDDLRFCDAQDRTTSTGKIWRLDVVSLSDFSGGPTPLGDLAMPDNPFVASSDGMERLVWAYGLRNPFRFSIDPATGDLAIGDVGSTVFEEVDIADQGGLNFGWPKFEGTTSFLSCGGISIEQVEPAYAYGASPSNRRAIIMGPAYRLNTGHQQFPLEYDGDVFYCDYYQGDLIRLKENAGSWQVAAPVAGQPHSTAWATGIERPADFVVGADGAIWYCSAAFGEVRRIYYTESTVGVSVSRGVPSPLYFDIQGRRVDEPNASGIYFLRDKSPGTKKKVVVR